MAITVLIYMTVLLTSICAIAMFYKLGKQAPVALSTLDYVKLCASGFIAFIADALGAGSFAINVALAKLLGTFSDHEMPSVNNGAQVIPGVFESIFFMQLIDVDISTLLTLVIGTCIGGVIGGAVVSHLSKQVIRLIMAICFLGLIVLWLAQYFHLMPSGGDATALYGSKLIFGFFAMIVCGCLTSAGIGLFALVQGVLFLMNVSPLIAYPIMTTAGAMQQPLTTLVFLQQDKIPLKKTLILSLSGCLGVAFTLQIFAHLTISWLHGLLLCVLIYNFCTISSTYLKEKSAGKFHLPQGDGLATAE